MAWFSFPVYRPPLSGINILTNPGFEQPLVNDPVKGWSCQGETDDPRGGVIARYTRQQPKEGQHSGICLARLSEWAGPGQYIGKFLVRNGHNLSFIENLIFERPARNLK